MAGRVADAFAGGPAFIPYLVAGDPDEAASRRYVAALARGGADAIELGLPFSDPIAEGPTIQRAIGRALDAGMTPERYFSFAASLDVDVPLLCMTYYNLVYQYGRQDTGEPGPRPFVERAADAGIAGLIVPDLPAEEADPLREACTDAGLDLIFIVAPTTREGRLDRIREVVTGFVYVQARLGTTGARRDLSDRTEESLRRLADWDVPRAVGFGVSSGEQARRIVAAGADGVIVGSALVDIVADGVEAGDDPADVAARLEEIARGIKDGALAGAADASPEPEQT